LIKLENLRGSTALDILENYSGTNSYICKIKRDLEKNKISLTETQIDYIMENHNKEPILINRVLGITSFLGEELQKKERLSFVPERILVEYIIGENDKSYHISGKLKKNQEKSQLYWIPKTQLIDDPFYETKEVNVNFDTYNKILANYNKKLYQHQEDGIKFLLSRNSSILADDMGLGKSVQSIIAALESGAKKILIICPSSLKINWRREINLFTDDVAIVEGRKWKSAKFTIINYDILKNFHTLGDGKKKKNTDPVLDLNRHIVNAGFDLMIVDEAHYLKNNKSIRGEIVSDLVVNHNIEKVWLLTGTPISNRPIDFYNLLRIIKSPLAQNWQYFAVRYCDARKIWRTLKNGLKKQIWLTDGASNLDELAAKTKNLILRRLKTEVLDMPDKIVTPVYHDLTDKQYQEYNELWDDYLEKRALEKKKGPIQRDLVELILLRKFIAMEAIPHTIEMVENAIEMGKKAIVFTTFTEELQELHEHFGKSSVIHYGPMSDKDKQKSVDAFQNNDNINVFIGNIVSAGVGITLTKSDFVIFNSFSWVPGLNEQAEDRAFRIGQDKNVNVYYQMFENTISIRMWETLRNKKDIISSIIGDKKISDEEIIELMTDKLFLNYE
jgi:SWI/SNF-related matrix-associated actin-dependent regulator of chromatin subfamily A-like protein 1